MTPRKVRIAWLDHYDLDAEKWANVSALTDDALTPPRMESVGWLIAKTRLVYVVTHTLQDDATVMRGAFVILRSAVVDKEWL